jgi:hypothetical protein
LSQKQHLELHAALRAQDRSANEVSHTGWVTAMVRGGFDLLRIKKITRLPLTSILRIAKQSEDDSAELMTLLRDIHTAVLPTQVAA